MAGSIWTKAASQLETERQVKPRLKPLRDGSLSVIKKGINPWGEASARTYIQEQYGSLSAFASRYRFPYSAVCKALRSPVADEMAGSVAKVRQVLGLPSRPTKMAQIAARSAKRRQQ